MKNAYDLILFDFDGTLADSFPWFMSVLNEVARKYRFKRVAAEDADRFRGYSSREVVRHLGIPFWKLPFIARHMRKLAAEDSQSIRLFEGVDEMLARLSGQGIVLAIVTSNSEKKVRQVLGTANAERIRFYDCGVGMFAKRKALKRVLEKSSISAVRALYVGDETRDAEAAAGVGIAFGAVSWGYAKAETLQAHGARKVFQKMAEIGV